ncbi:hypothetical protein M422DRAFT_219839 [Sphaerobolus stellatus SS14]|nr:hypothetical protein M422DRAFT_219839 [Sphaerobolus stellatus SS14]
MYLSEGIEVNRLPQSIKDAIKCTHGLKLRYLWIDSLCILQDSEEDKDSEIPRMCDIYHNAYVTIIAASARKVSEGFLQERREPIDSELPFWCPDGQLGTISVDQEGRSPEGGVEPVDRRAWYKPLTDDDKRIIRNAWWNCVSEYTTRNLTDPSDKLNAISGIAQLFSRSWGINNQYVAGMWEANLSGDLLWQRKSTERSSASAATGGRFQVPSWSWAAINYAISGGPSMMPENILWEIRGCEIITVVPNNPFSAVKGGQLVVNAIVRPVLWDSESAELYEAEQPKQMPIFKKGHAGYVYLDDFSSNTIELQHGTGRVHGFAIVVGTNGAMESIQYLTGLLVNPVGGMKGTFRRVGVFHANGRSNEDEDEDAPFCEVHAWLSMRRQVVIIK